MINAPKGVSQLIHGRNLTQKDKDKKLMMEMLVSVHLCVEWQREVFITVHTNTA